MDLGNYLKTWPEGSALVPRGRPRTGCITCRKQKRKCDERKPGCLNCEKKSLTCEGYPEKTKWRSARQRAEEDMIMEPLPSTTEIPQPVSTEVDDPFAVISNNKPGFRYMYPQAAPTPINEDDVVWNKIYTAANSRMYNKHHKNANEARKYREAGETRVLALRMLASNKVKHDLAVAAAKLAGVPFSSSTSKTSEPTRKNPYDSFKGGALFLLGVLRDGAFHCQHLQLCPQRFETAEELRIHFELAHFHFTRISPASRYICSTCENITPCLNGPCSCRTTESIELWICGRFIKTPGSKYSPSPCPDSDLKTDTDETISESCQDPEHTPESTQNRKRSSVSSSPSQKRPRVTEPGSDSDTIDLFPCKSCDLPPFRDEASFHQHIISNHITTTRSDRKLEFSKRRAIGACTDCRRRKVRCLHGLPTIHQSLGGIPEVETYEGGWDDDKSPLYDQNQIEAVPSRQIENESQAIPAQEVSKCPRCSKDLALEEHPPICDLHPGTFGTRNENGAKRDLAPVTSRSKSTPLGNYSQIANQINFAPVTQSKFEEVYSEGGNARHTSLPLFRIPEVTYMPGLTCPFSPWCSSASDSTYSTQSDGQRNLPQSTNRSRSASIAIPDRPTVTKHWAPNATVAPQDLPSPRAEDRAQRKSMEGSRETNEKEHDDGRVVIIDDRNTDSGYHTGIGTDTASVISCDSIGPWSGLSLNVLQELITKFTNTLLETTSVTDWACAATIMIPPQVMETRVAALLKNFSLELLPLASIDQDSKKKIEACLFIRRNGQRIARCFRESASTTAAAEVFHQLKFSNNEISLEEKMRNWELSSDMVCKEVDDASDDGEAELPIEFSDAKEFLISSQPFQHLIERFQALYYDRDEMLLTIRLGHG